MACRGNSARGDTPCWRTRATDAADYYPNRATTLPVWRIAAASIDVIFPCCPLLCCSAFLDFGEGLGGQKPTLRRPVWRGRGPLCPSSAPPEKNEGAERPQEPVRDAAPLACLALTPIAG